ncbi:heavy metal translocating P-type ATPase [Companilactobacillus allii]|uniref:Cd(2+)-exporting ATPase n=1 Tax=Companilactobacillus allii TaxID=1847728 RepID=A0A1P8Q0G3_9LACO|nr:heavy metal translocating P-type ATPase [Companilactobacillus allii]APX71326.1 cadmium-translocating P-type ATPase [Companilactobacillus allii]USQ68406.1 heavy metal translocating P-type ATPase [Companilactobacillus allii]
MKLYNVQSEYGVKNKQKKSKNKLDQESIVRIWKLIISAIFMIIGFSKLLAPNISILFYFIGYFVIGGGIVFKAVRNIFHGKIFDENFLMTIATVGALVLGEYPEAVAVMFFYEVGNLFEDIATNNSKRSISALLEVKPNFATLKLSDKTKHVDPSVVQIGQVIVVKPGEKIPLDGVVIAGNSNVDTSALTGESMPQSLTIDDEALSGSINQNGTLEIKVTKKYSDSTVVKILDMVQNASAKKAPAEKFITRFAKIYTPIVVAMALMLAILPPLVTGEWSMWISRALVFLVISCPCALVISVPLSFFGGIGAASKQGVLVKGSSYLELLNDVDTIAFDKTGTLTKGKFEVIDVAPIKSISKQELLSYAAAVEQNSTHPIAQSIEKSFKGDLRSLVVSNVNESAGQGISATVNGKMIVVGNAKSMRGIDIIKNDNIGTIVYVSADNEFMGSIVIADEPKDDAKSAIELLHKRGIKSVMLTGDNESVGLQTANKLGLDQAFTQLLPEDKVNIVADLLKKSRERNKKVAFVGDGINDTPVLTSADIGFAMGGLGSDAAVEAADIVIMGDEPSKVSKTIKIAQVTRKIVMENISFAIGIKVLFLILGAFGFVGMWQAVFADVGVTVIAVLNAVRLEFLK